MSQTKMLYLCLIVIHSLLYGSEVPSGVSQIHIMFPSAGSGIWISDLAVRYVKSHVARQLPGDPTAAEAEARRYPNKVGIHLRPHRAPPSCPLAAPSDFKWGSEGAVARVYENSLLQHHRRHFQRRHVPIRETTANLRLLDF